MRLCAIAYPFDPILTPVCCLLLFLSGCSGGSPGTASSLEESIDVNEHSDDVSWRAAVEDISVGMSRAEFDHAIKRFRVRLPEAVKKDLRPLPPMHVLSIMTDDARTTVVLHVQPIPGLNGCYAVFSNNALDRLFIDRGAFAQALPKIHRSIFKGDLRLVQTLALEFISSAPDDVSHGSLLAAIDQQIDDIVYAQKFLEPSPILQLFTIFDDKGAGAYRRSSSLISKYDASNLKLGYASASLNKMSLTIQRINETRSGEVRVYGERAATGWYPNPRLSVLNENGRIQAAYTNYVTEY